MSTGRGFVIVTPSDTENVSRSNGNYPAAVRFGTGGTAVIVGVDGSVVTFTNIADGEMLPVAFKRINTTGSSSIADIVGIYL